MLRLRVVFILVINLFVSPLYIESTENAQFMSGFYTDGLDTVHDKVEIVYPEKVTKDGSFVSYYLPHYYNVESAENRPRREERSAKDALHFYVPIEGEKYHLELWPNFDFIAPTLIVERRDARDVENVNKAKLSRVSQQQCHYNGRILGKPSSSAALSTCYGLAGYIRVPAGDEYLIEPVKDSKPAPDKEHPHIIYKRSGKDKHSGSNCLTKGRAKEALNERLQWEALFGDQVRQELTGTNLNEIVQEKLQPKPTNNEQNNFATFDQYVSPNQMTINSNKNSQTEGNFNGQPILNTNQILKNNENVPFSENTFKNSGLPKFDNRMGNGQLFSGGKLKERPVKEQRNMGTIQLPDVNLQSSIGDSNQMSNVDMYNIAKSGTLDHKRDNYYKHRLKRSIDSEMHDYNDENVDSNAWESVDKIDNDLGFSEQGRKQQVLDENISNERYRRGSDLEDEFKNMNKLENLKKGIGELNQNVDQKYQLNAVETKEQTSQDKNEKENLLHQFETTNTKKEKKHIGPGIIEEKNEYKRIPSEIKDFENNQKQKSNEKREIRLENRENKGSNSANEEQSKINKKPNEYEFKNGYDKDIQSAKFGNLQFDNLKASQKSIYDPGKLNQFKGEEREQNSVSGKNISSGLESVLEVNIEDLKLKKETNERELKSDAAKDSQTPVDKLSSQDSNKLAQFEQISVSKNHDKNAASEKDETNARFSFISKEAAGEYNANNEQESPKSVSIERSDQNSDNEIVIRIKTPEGTANEINHINAEVSDPKIGLNKYKPNANRNENVQIIEMDRSGMESKSKEKSKRGIPNKQNENQIKNTMVIESNHKVQYQNNEKDKLNVAGQQHETSQNYIGQSHKAKRDDNTIHLIIESEPEINSDNSNTNAQKPGLFCQGKNCLEIKPIILNDTIASVAQSNNNSNTESTKSKIMEKRQAFSGECKSGATTEEPLICFDDIYAKMFSIELMVTVDFKVVKMHEDDDIENFILTIINMVATNFYDKTVGLNLSVVLVRLILLNTCIKELDSDRFNPEELLENFCTWQVLINPGKDDHPHHHDLAIFVTRMEKCEGKVMGVTYMTSVCRPDKACLVCVDEGLLLANTITHQIGHSLGAEHDDSSSGSGGCAGVLPDGTSMHMSPVITETSSAWSPCSRDAIVQFMKTQGSWCLNDSPIERSFNFPLMLPGQIYSAAQQCKLNFHMTALPCAVGSFCDKLYCQVTEKLCATKGDPPADGTFCASDMWCFHKQCVHIGRRPGAINGEWGPWTEWTVCTRSCGGGVSSSYRICNKPKPSNGGRYCVGERIRHRMCATMPCTGMTESFRDMQCKRTEDRPFRGKLSNWSQYQSFFLNIECALVCQNRKGEVVMRSPIVADGTPCKAGTRNVCIQGTCRNVGCDWVIESNAKEDACGVCHGNGTECKIIQGVFSEDTTQKALVEFLRIPKNAGMVFVREASPSTNTIVVSGTINRIYYLNGPTTEASMPGDVSFGITHGVYEQRSGMERIFIRGPTTEELVFYVFFREPNKGIHYQYAVPETDPTYVPRYLWQYLDWDACTDPCSGGSQRAHPKCVEDRGGVVDDQYCTGTTKPMDIIRPCNDFPCQSKWWVSVWSDCICTGMTSVMFRSVLCMRATDESGTRSEIVRESECAGHKKPQTQKACNATDEDNECVNKRSVVGDDVFSARHMRAISPKTAYVEFPVDGSPGMQEVELHSDNVSGNKEEEGSDKNEKKLAKTQNSKNLNIKNYVNKLKPKINERSPEFEGKKSIAALKGKEMAGQKVKLQEKENQKKGKSEEISLPAKGKQTSKLNSKDISATIKESKMKEYSDKSKLEGDSASDSSDDEPKIQCDTTTVTDGTCATQATDPPECSTCKQTCAVLPHKRTTCCKTTPKQLPSKCPEITTARPAIVQVDDLDTHDFGLTIIPMEPKKKTLPQSDPEFIHLGNVGQFAVANRDNATVIKGQEAIDFLDFARANASGEPAILHDVHN